MSDNQNIDTNKAYELLKREITSVTPEYLPALFTELFEVVDAYRRTSLVTELKGSGLNVSGKSLVKESLTNKEQERYDLILQSESGMTANELADALKSNRNLESVYLTKIRRKGWLEMVKRDRFSVYRVV